MQFNKIYTAFKDSKSSKTQILFEPVPAYVFFV